MQRRRCCYTRKNIQRMTKWQDETEKRSSYNSWAVDPFLCAVPKIKCINASAFPLLMQRNIFGYVPSAIDSCTFWISGFYVLIEAEFCIPRSSYFHIKIAWCYCRFLLSITNNWNRALTFRLGGGSTDIHLIEFTDGTLRLVKSRFVY